ncbi:MAG TPA: ATP-binding protein, partial [Candidatus Hydrogenedentes bacterium]|nr:ATP-binding protein [Candidatus Hydrogenedentota bacterium]
HADPDLIRVVYENLIGNAIKYGRVDGVITLEARADNNRLELSVWNEGKPISPERLPHIFNKFQRYDVEENTGKSGTGLGLFIVKQIIDQHGGTIRAESSEVEGTRFTFILSPALDP